jgi:hypothetical protein
LIAGGAATITGTRRDVTVRFVLGGERQLLALDEFFRPDGFGLLSRSMSTKLGARKAKRPVRRI